MGIFDYLNPQPQYGIMRYLGLPGADKNTMAVPQTPTTRSNPVMENPRFTNSITRLGLNMMAASSQPGATPLGALGVAGNATLSTMDALNAQDRELAVKEGALAAEYNKLQNPYAALGTGRDSGVIAARAQQYEATGLSPQQAISKAYDDVVGSEVQTYTDPNKGVMQVKRQPLPSIGGALPVSSPVAGGLLPAPQGVEAGNVLGLPAGTLQPPPVAGGTGQPIGQTPARVGTPITGLDAIDANARNQANQANIALDKDAAAAVNADVASKYPVIQNLNQLLDASEDAFGTGLIPRDAKTSIARALAPNDPAISQQIAATGQMKSAAVQALGPQLRELVGTGPVSNVDYKNAMNVFGNPNATAAEIQAVVGPLREKVTNTLKVKEIKQAGDPRTEAAIAKELGIDWTTGFKVGGSASDYLPNKSVLKYNPDTGDFD